jgi:hypothetical protein
MEKVKIKRKMIKLTINKIPTITGLYLYYIKIQYVMSTSYKTQIVNNIVNVSCFLFDILYIILISLINVMYIFVQLCIISPIILQFHQLLTILDNCLVSNNSVEIVNENVSFI